MSDAEERHQENIEALEALASGDRSPLAETPAEGEAEAAIGPSSGLMLLEEEPQDRSPDDVLQTLAGDGAAEETGELSDLAAAASEAPDDELANVAAVSTSVTPQIQPQRAARLQASTRRSHAHAYKRTMVPLLIAVGVLLIAFSGLTLFILMGGGSDEPGALGGPGTYLRVYGKYFILVALPLGAILLMGAWLFYVDVRNSERRNR